ncbi:lmo0171 family class 1 internalin [Listeria monocytogenes serotype 1/2b]|nr:lmo0171 family class 1 internalin [Listeria monocytogenes]EHC6021608.1 lmo0171 family class 1 internalin [Listeria monocytogenes serotype 1/2a]EHC6176880.1 lmo0171 family class 1 internalin [Listeria monocytogenes serotype 1/2b]EAC8452724.1 lmo0171 family class 1 internalin [Listeria monocytogenes]EAF8207256.1 lmo0171 family class 1 internalin [Listeria monocytogenes]
MRKIPVVVSLALCFSLVSPSLYASADTITADQITKEATTDTTEPTTIDQPSRMDNSQTAPQKMTASSSEEAATTNSTEEENTPKNNLKSTSENSKTYAELFPDVNLAKIIAKNISGTEDINAEVSEAELQTITNLVATNQNITSLTGIEHLTALENINVNNNELRTIDSLFNMPTLKSISANNNKITGNFSLVKTLPELHTLEVLGNAITELDIENQPNLVTLSADELELKKLTLKNLSQLNGLGRIASSISIDWGDLESVTLMNLPEIISVDISGNYLDSDDIHLENLPAVKNLDISSNELTRLPKINDFPLLTTINVRSNKIDRLESSKLVDVPKLATLNADKQAVTLSKTIAAGNFTIPNNVENLAGQMVTPKIISNNGTYSDQSIAWASGELSGLSKVSYTFDEVINSPAIAGKYTGTVNQPIEVKAVPVIVADKSVSYAPVNAKDEATFLQDIRASASENAQITSDYSEVVDFATPGDYTVTLHAKNEFDLKADPVTVVVHINDIQKPQVAVNSNDISFEVGTELTSEVLLAKSGAVVTDLYDEAIKMEVDLSEVDSSKLGTYEATIIAKSKSGASSDPIKLSVKIVDTEKPIIQINNPEIIIEKGSELTEGQIIDQVGITATDNYDQDLNIHMDLSKVDTSKPGSYEVTIYTEDSSGNRSETVTITVKVPEAKIGKITIQYMDSENNELAESNTITGEVGETYETLAKEIEGYTLKENPANSSGVFEETRQTIQYIYVKDIINPEFPVYSENNVTPELPSNNNNSVNGSRQTPSKSVKKQSKAYSKINQMPMNLPETGDSTNLLFIFMGVLLLAGLTLSKAKRKNQ